LATAVQLAFPSAFSNSSLNTLSSSAFQIGLAIVKGKSSFEAVLLGEKRRGEEGEGGTPRGEEEWERGERKEEGVFQHSVSFSLGVWIMSRVAG